MGLPDTDQMVGNTTAFFGADRVRRCMLQDVVGRLPAPTFLDVHNGPEALSFVIDLPGVTPETLSVRVEDRQLVIDARREKPRPAAYTYVRDDRSLFLDTRLPLPPGIDSQAASATLERGVLTVTLPKRRPSEPPVAEHRDD